MKYYLCDVVLAHKLGWMVVAGLLGITLLCTGLGCGNDDGVTSTETETVEVTNRYVGEDVYFEMDGSFLEGYVVEGVSADEVNIRLDNNSEMTISIDSIKGTLLDDHPDLGIRVVMLGDREKGELSIGGDIIAVYDDGMRKIKFFLVRYTDGTLTDLDTERIRFVHEDADFEEGGYLTAEEYRKWLDEL